jgi:hypothetical protein
MLGIQDPIVFVAYLACISAAAACLIYGFVNWNRGGSDEPPTQE